MTIQEAGKWLGAVCNERYDEREAAAITQLVMEKLTGLNRSSRALHRSDELSAQQEADLKKYSQELALSRPVQYVLGEAWFAGLRFYVDERVLIPRPETEELVAWIAQEKVHGTVTLLDIGTGSGCIPCALAKQRSDLTIRACDISPAALEVAKKNAADLGVSIDFFVADLLDPAFGAAAGIPDIVVSNPPYIPETYRSSLDPHVAGYEPGLALFVAGDDPLLYFKKIGEWIKTLPGPGPAVFLELHHDHAKATAAWFSENGFHTELRKDYSGNNRMLRARR